MIYAQLVENNDWEGERWCFYLPVEGNEGTLKFLNDALDGDTYAITKEYLTEAEVNALVKFGGAGYMDLHTKLNGIVDLKKLQKAMENPMDDPLYKGGIADFFIK